MLHGQTLDPFNREMVIWTINETDIIHGPTDPSFDFVLYGDNTDIDVRAIASTILSHHEGGSVLVIRRKLEELEFPHKAQTTAIWMPSILSPSLLQTGRQFIKEPIDRYDIVFLVFHSFLGGSQNPGMGIRTTDNTDQFLVAYKDAYKIDIELGAIDDPNA